ncbi:MAG: hypothetical protein QXT86_11400 [Archaeoglobaceae archaeon]
MAIKGLEMALTIFGSSSEKGQAILSALNRLSKVVDEKELMKAEIAFESLLGAPMLGTPPSPPSPPPTTSPILEGGVAEIPGIPGMKP